MSFISVMAKQFSAAITPKFSVKLSFRNHFNMLILCSRIIIIINVENSLCLFLCLKTVAHHINVYKIKNKRKKKIKGNKTIHFYSEKTR